MITPGIHPNFDIDQYFADPCASPSLSQSIAKILLAKSPRHAWQAHPRLNPNYEPYEDETNSRAKEIGNAAHALLLGRSREIEIGIFDDWRTKAAREFRGEQRAAGRMPILARHYETAAKMVEAVRLGIDWADFVDDWEAGDGEVCVIADDAGTHLRALIDWLPRHHRRVWDYKTTSASAAPQEIPKKLVNDGWDIQAGMHERILNILDPANAGRRSHLFIVQENYEPFAMTITVLPESVMTGGRAKVDRAIAIWRACMERDQWPSYPPGVLTAEYPAWELSKLAAMEETDGE